MNLLRPQHIWHKVQTGAATLTYGNPLYRYMLQGDVPEQLAWLPQALGAGDAAQGEELLRSSFAFGGERCHGWPPPWQPQRASQNWREMLHGFSWLDDLRTEGSPAAQQMSVGCIADWLDGQDRWQYASWSAPVLGARLASWIGNAAFYQPALTPELHKLLMVSIARQVRHLVRLVPGNLAGLSAVTAYKGLVYGALNLGEEGTKHLGLALSLLPRLLSAEILPDGGQLCRAPSLMLSYLQQLLEIRAALATHNIAAPPELDWAIKHMVPALRSLRHGDGGFALFHGGQSNQALLIDRILDRSAIRARGGKSLPHLGYERLQGGRCLLLCDTALPPPRGQDDTAHAGLLSFEFSHGRDRLITNCGGGPLWGEWRQALAATAAHSTLLVADTNAAEVLDQGGLGRRPRTVTARSYALDNIHTIEARHDGYREGFGLVHERVLSLADDGSWLRGRDVLHGPGVYPYTIRFHLHPKMQANLLQNGQAVLLRSPSGQGWKLLADGGQLALEPSLYYGDGTARRAEQIIISARSGADVPLQWLLQRMEKASN